ncbi:ribonuclease J [Apilactobacillus apisilvae]|uniref:Ribonuclease J n=1 Tax=Apilactobacillus apisilvae TaxID=2923364 RepID=A0ABY4PIN0_9LACO|nr:ribonuclease J [Apilactobacillus apisilvae]UQS85510.1 ribonuclease J [Apilactobacillus apisilvae]
MKNNIKIIPLGGVRENGKNLYAVEINDGIYILDCGLKYPENGMLGIDVVIPDFSYLEENKDKIVGVFLSNGQDDSIGALPYFLSDFNVPIFGSKLTIELAKNEINDNPKSKSFNDYNVIDPKSEIIFNDVTVSFFKTSYSIPDSMGIVLSTNEGQIVYTGDFKFDPALKGEYKTAYGDIARVGEKKVIALLSDSGNADNPFPMDNELKAERYIFNVLKDNDERIVIAANSSNILRLQQVFNAAAESERKVYIGHDLSKKVITAIELGYLVIPKDDMIIKTAKELNELDKHEIVILETNPVGEPIKVIQRMASQKEKSVNLIPGDVVLIVTTPSPALDNTMAKTRDMVYRADGQVKTVSDDLNISNHASDEDLQMMMDLLNPEYVIPVNGEYMMMDASKKTAIELGIDKNNVFITNKGDVLEYDGNKIHHGNSVDAGNTMIDGIGIGDIGNIVLRDRKVLSEDGIFIVVVTIDRKKKLIISKPKITSRGFIYVKTNKDLMNDASQIVSKTIQSNLDNKEFDWSHLKQAVREQISHFLFDETKRRPVILPVIMEVNQHHRRNKHTSKKNYKNKENK